MEEEIKEGNKIISEKIGFGVKDFDRNWNSLMMIIEKIENLENQRVMVEEVDGDGCIKNVIKTPYNFHIDINRRFTRVIYDWDKFITNEGINDESISKDWRFCIFDESKILATFFAVVDLIKYLNDKKIDLA